jgi:hypothetical protein
MGSECFCDAARTSIFLKKVNWNTFTELCGSNLIRMPGFCRLLNFKSTVYSIMYLQYTVHNKRPDASRKCTAYSCLHRMASLDQICLKNLAIIHIYKLQATKKRLIMENRIFITGPPPEGVRAGKTNSNAVTWSSLRIVRWGSNLCTKQHAPIPCAGYIC